MPQVTDLEVPWVTASVGPHGYQTGIRAGDHQIIADEPASVGGGGSGPTPYDLLLAAVAGCTAMTMRMYASRKGWPLDGAEVSIRTARTHAKDCLECEEKPLPKLALERRIVLKGALSEEQRERLLQVADRCPVKQMLDPRIEIRAA